MGLKTNDVIIKMDNIEAENIGALIELRSKKKRGDRFTLTILRKDVEIILAGKFPEVTRYNSLYYSIPSGVVKAKYFANHFEIETSRISEIAIYIHPEMVNRDIPVIINVNGTEIVNKKVSIDRNFMVDNFIENLDRRAVWVYKFLLKID